MRETSSVTRFLFVRHLLYAEDVGVEETVETVVVVVVPVVGSCSISNTTRCNRVHFTNTVLFTSSISNT